MKKVIFLITVTLVLGCNKEGYPKKVDPKPVCKSENEQVLLVFEKNDKCGGLAEFVYDNGNVTNLEMYIPSDGEEDIKVELNMTMEGNEIIYITPSIALLKYI